ncbi:MAG: phosphatidate cytidylyltransferase [Mangrovibacterium sp.]
MNNLIQRSLTAVVIVAIMLTGLFVHEYTFCILFLAIMLGMLHEFFNMTKSTIFLPNRWIISGISTILYLVSFFVAAGTINSTYLFITFPLLLVIFVHELLVNKKNPLQNIALGLLAIIYVVAPMCLCSFIVFHNAGAIHSYYNPQLFIVLMIIIWTYDSFAYLFGMSFGKHRLFERVSPKKSWEGAIGGAISAILVSILISNYLEAKIIEWIIISLGVVITSTLGDLTESLFKRQMEIKDSGSIFPGHGGLLDRFDSVLFAAPVYICLLELLNL